MVNLVDSNDSQYPGTSAWSPPEKPSAHKVSHSQFPPEIDGMTNKKNPTSGTIEKGKATKECQTCKRRKYADGSIDPSLSFKAPTSLSPEAASMAVAARENEHVWHERAKAAQQGRDVVYQAVQFHTGICPECGKRIRVRRENNDGNQGETQSGRLRGEKYRPRNLAVGKFVSHPAITIRSLTPWPPESSSL